MADEEGPSRDEAYTYPVYPDVRVMAISWNMGNAKPEGLNTIVPSRGGDFDIITFGLQESTWSAKSDDDSGCVEYLLCEIQGYLTDDFVKIAHNKRAQMQQLVYVRYTIKERITDVLVKSENTGFFHVFPNKGGLRVSMIIDGTKVAFISCHLAAHEGADKCATRNSSVEEIFDGVLTVDNLLDMHHTFFMGDMNYRCTFSKKTPADLVAATQESKTDKRNGKIVVGKKMSSIDEPDEEERSLVPSEADSDVEDQAVEVRVDKNQREIDMNNLYDMITEEKWDDMLRLDELTREMAAHRALVGYIAPQPRFPPTFKRTRKVSIQRREGGGTQLEEALKSAIPREQTKEFNLDMDNEGCSSRAVISTFFHPKRLPSFTDRILTKSMPAFQGALRNESFTSGEDAISSDHKPVIATYTLTTYGGLRGIMAYNPNMVSNTFPRYTTNTTYRIKNLKGYNLAEMDSALFGGGSDPYVVLWSDPRQILIGKKLRTPTITHELNPVWTEGIEFRLATNDTTGLSQNAHLFLSVWDFDVTNEDDLIGTFTIALKDLFEHYSNTSGSDFHFRGSLVRNGLHHGEIEGDIELGGRREPEEAHRVKMRKGRTQTLYDALSHRNLGEPTPGTLGCGCNVS